MRCTLLTAAVALTIATSAHADVYIISSTVVDHKPSLTLCKLYSTTQNVGEVADAKVASMKANGAAQDQIETDKTDANEDIAKTNELTTVADVRNMNTLDRFVIFKDKTSCEKMAKQMKQAVDSIENAVKGDSTKKN